MKNTISIIIPTYNRSKTLATTIRSLISQSFNKENYEILVIDNDSSDDTKEVVEKIVEENKNGPEIRYIFEGRAGVHFARNRGAKEAKNEILYFTDDDMEADRNVLEELIKVFHTNDKIGTATGLVLPKFDVAPPAWVLKHCLNSILSVNVEKKDSGMIVAKESFGVFNCHQAVDKEVFFKTSGVHPENTKGLWIGDGDTGLNQDIKNLGFLFAFTPKSITYHCIPKERATQKYVNKRMFNQGYCDSFTQYRLHRSLVTTFFQTIEQILRIPYFFIKTIFLFIIFNSKWHLTLGQIFYSYARIKYNFILFFDPKIRAINTQETWLET